MTHPKNAKDQTQYPQIIAAMAISIAATTFVDHPLYINSLLPKRTRDYCSDHF